MDKNEKMLKEEFYKEMTGKSLKRVNLDKCLEKVLNIAIKNTSAPKIQFNLVNS